MKRDKRVFGLLNGSWNIGMLDTGRQKRKQLFFFLPLHTTQNHT
jgi:hypothetical protein